MSLYETENKLLMKRIVDSVFLKQFFSKINQFPTSN